MGLKIGSERNQWLAQLTRYGLVGAASALIYTILYLALAELALPDGWAVAAVPPAFLAAASFGYVAHSGWSFRGHGSSDPGPRRQLKFLIVQGGGMVLNAAFTWIVTSPMDQPNWAALIPCGLITPLLTYWLQRRWVFG